MATILWLDSFILLQLVISKSLSLINWYGAISKTCQSGTHRTVAF